MTAGAEKEYQLCMSLQKDPSKFNSQKGKWGGKKPKEVTLRVGVQEMVRRERKEKRSEE